MEKSIERRKKITRVTIWVIAILGLLSTMHILVNNFHIVEAIKALHGG